MLLKLNSKKIRFVLYGAFFLCTQFIFSQEHYFQQEVNFKIDVQLNDSLHSLRAFEEIEYINNSPSTLNFIYFHLWPNAYKNSSTALCKQLLVLNKSDLFFSKIEEQGFIDSLNFLVDGKPVKIIYDSACIDICKLILNAPLQPAEKIEITTPFYVKIPDAKFSRLGHTQQAYYITQWYPKPAVYDKEGWHPMPYLDQGEFYSEFGSFDVKISLPENYVLAATGDRVNANEEEEFLNKRVQQTQQLINNNTADNLSNKYPASSKKYKTIEFKQSNIHDFAWFADKRFCVLHDSIELPQSKRKINTWSFFTPQNLSLWKNSVEYIKTSALFYSSHVGEYPYKHITAIDGTIMAGGGMEYPNITVIGNMDNPFDLDATIAHEVGHNWFYGILANNERDVPFMDEGINTFYETWYLRKKYPNQKLTLFLGQDSTFKLFKLHKTPIWKGNDFIYLLSHLSNLDQKINLKSEQFSDFNYASIMYSKTALTFDYLMQYMGERKFDSVFQWYFNENKFKHVQPNDLFKLFSSASEDKLSWFEENFISSANSFDYKLKSVEKDSANNFVLTIKNKTKSSVPFAISAFKKGRLVETKWVEGFLSTKKIIFQKNEIDKFQIDAEELLPENNRKNNFYKLNSIFHKTKMPQLNFITAYPNSKKNQINYLPLTAINLYDGAMVGIAVHNYGFLPKKFDWVIAPLYGTFSKSLVGFAQLDYNIYPKKYFRIITIGNKYKTFSKDVYTPKQIGGDRNLFLGFAKNETYLHLEFKKQDANSKITHYLNLRTVSLSTALNNVPKLQNYFAISSTYSLINTITYKLNNSFILSPHSLEVNLQQTNSVVKLWTEFNLKYLITKKNDFQVRCFFGSFLTGDKFSKAAVSFKSSGFSGYNDYMYEYNYLGRSASDGIGFNQFTERDGALKVWTALGSSYTWMGSINIKSPKIGILPVRAFADVVVGDGQFLLKDKLLWDAGLNITLLKSICEIYIPLAYNSDLRKVLDLNKINGVDRIRFTFNIHKLVPKNFIQSFFIP